MLNRLKKALYALMLILLITLGCLAFMPWRMSEVVPQLQDIQKCMIYRYDGSSYATAYPKDGQLQELTEVLCEAKGHFDRAREDIHYEEEAPLYRIYLWDSVGKIPEIWLCGNQFFCNNAQYVLGDEAADEVNRALTACFEECYE